MSKEQQQRSREVVLLFYIDLSSNHSVIVNQQYENVHRAHRLS